MELIFTNFRKDRKEGKTEPRSRRERRVRGRYYKNGEREPETGNRSNYRPTPPFKGAGGMLRETEVENDSPS